MRASSRWSGSTRGNWCREGTSWTRSKGGRRARSRWRRSAGRTTRSRRSPGAATCASAPTTTGTTPRGACRSRCRTAPGSSRGRRRVRGKARPKGRSRAGTPARCCTSAATTPTSRPRAAGGPARTRATGRAAAAAAAEAEVEEGPARGSSSSGGSTGTRGLRSRSRGSCSRPWWASRGASGRRCRSPGGWRTGSSCRTGRTAEGRPGAGAGTAAGPGTAAGSTAAGARRRAVPGGLGAAAVGARRRRGRRRRPRGGGSPGLAGAAGRGLLGGGTAHRMPAAAASLAPAWPRCVCRARGEATQVARVDRGRAEPFVSAQLSGCSGNGLQALAISSLVDPSHRQSSTRRGEGESARQVGVRAPSFESRSHRSLVLPPLSPAKRTRATRPGELPAPLHRRGAPHRDAATCSRPPSRRLAFHALTLLASPTFAHRAAPRCARSSIQPACAPDADPFPRHSLARTRRTPRPVPLSRPCSPASPSALSAPSPAPPPRPSHPAAAPMPRTLATPAGPRSS